VKLKGDLLMTEVMNFFQSIFTFNNCAPASISKAETELAASLKTEARKLAAKADEEMRNGRKTQDLMFEETDKERSRIFAEITIWHLGRAAEAYRKSCERFEEAGKLQTGKRKAFNLMANKMERQAIEAETIGNLLNNFLRQN
jgi:hypothetical protein